MTKPYYFEPVTFDDVLPIWTDQLWQGRMFSKIEPISYLNHYGLVDMDIGQYAPSFFGVYCEGELIGVNSGHRTTDDMYRSRGLWVHPAHRRNSLGTVLLVQTIMQGRKEGCKYAWSLPRVEAVPAYNRAGFKPSDQRFDLSKMEFGPNVFMVAECVSQS